MGCDLSVSIVAKHEDTARAAFSTMVAIARSADAQFSRFLPESELSQLNSARSLTVSPEFMEALLLGKRLYRETEGAFNPLVDISRFGYDEDSTVVLGTNRTTIPDSQYDISFERITITGDIVTLAEGQHVDFGGFLKGHVAERMARAVPDLPGVIVNLGGDLFTLGHDADDRAFTFEIEDPRGLADLSFCARDRGIATSGSYRRQWSYHGTPFHHILDRSGSGNPETDILSATVIASSGVDADAYATAALVLSSQDAVRFLKGREVEYCLIREDDVVASIGMQSPLLATSYA